MSQPLISLCVITGNCEQYIARFLEQFAPVADEICFVRAIGNQAPDKTYEITRDWIWSETAKRESRGGYPYPFTNFIFRDYKNKPEHDWPHLDDFAAARNLSFSLATGQYIFWADTDDVLQCEPEIAREIVLQGSKDEPPCEVWVCPYEIFGQHVTVPRERIIKRGLGKWINPVHEHFKFEQEVGAYRDDRIVVRHLPYLSKKGSVERNLTIMGAIPEDELTPGMRYHKHCELIGAGKQHDAFLSAREALEKGGLGVPERYQLLIHCATFCNNLETAEQYLIAAYQADPCRREALALLTGNAIDMNEPARALAFARQMMATAPPQNESWNDRRAMYGWLGFDVLQQALRRNDLFEDAERIRKQLLVDSGGAMITLIHATKGRPKKAAAMRKLWLDLAENPGAVEHIFVIDDDDDESIPLFRMHHIVQPAGGGCVAAWNTGAGMSSGKILIQMSDDWIPPPRWDQLIIDRFVDDYLKDLGGCVENRTHAAIGVQPPADSGAQAEGVPGCGSYEPPTQTHFPASINEPTVEKRGEVQQASSSRSGIGVPLSGNGGETISKALSRPRVLAISDGARTDKLLCMVICTKAYHCLDFFLFHPDFLSVYSDNYFTDLAYSRGMVIEARDLVFKHDHPFFQPDTSETSVQEFRYGKTSKEFDKTYLEQNSPARYSQGEQIYSELKQGRDWSHVPGFFNYWPFYRQVASLLKDGDSVAEIGVWFGRSIIYLAQACRKEGKDVHFYAVDHFKGEKEQPAHMATVAAHGGSIRKAFEENIKRCGVEDMITILDGDSVNMANKVPDKSLAFCWIDGDHDEAKRDILAWLPKVKGTIAGHDAQYPPVMRDVKEIFADDVMLVGPAWMHKVK
jgi:glycosyltransferase involved in cell wall biosynthesis